MTRLGREGWTALISEFTSSGKTHKEFAAERGVALATLQFWIYKLRRESRHDSPPTILPVELIPSPASSTRAQGGRSERLANPALLEVGLPSGVFIRFTAGTDVRYVRQLLAALAP